MLPDCRVRLSPAWVLPDEKREKFTFNAMLKLYIRVVYIIIFDINFYIVIKLSNYISNVSYYF